MSARARFHRVVRLAQRLLVVSFGMGAATLSDGIGAAGGGALGGGWLMSGPAFASEIEGALVRAIVGLRETGLTRAMGEIDKALERNPNFRLGHMVKGDMLMARAGRPVAFASSAAAPGSVAPLQDEARVRLQRYFDAPRVDDLPAPILQLAPSQPHVLLVDTSRSRLFVYANDRGRPRYVADFYISLGKNGIEKQREGDQKTPIGVYKVVASRDRLPDFYGAGAFTLDYPNEWDRMQRRNGHGIWLHGSPSETYSRPPWATDGCVVLSNEDFARLARFVDVSRTPVVIGQSVLWHDARRWEAQRGQFLAAFDRWRADWESLDSQRYFSHYASQFRSDSRDLDAWKARKLKVNAGKKWVKVGVSDVSLFAYPGAGGMMMITFEQDYRSSNLSNRTVKRQYWIREGEAWRILHEALVS